MSDLNREGWLTEIAKRMEEVFSIKRYRLKPYRLTCGWPCRMPLSLRGRRIGECHPPSTSKGGVSEIFISPLLEDPLEVAGVVAHEMIHVIAGNEAGHKGPFIKVCREMGMVGKPTSASPGPTLNNHIQLILDKVGAYPHTALTPTGRRVVVRSRSVRLKCECGCAVSIKTEDAEDYGLPTCGCGLPFRLPKSGE